MTKHGGFEARWNKWTEEDASDVIKRQRFYINELEKRDARIEMMIRQLHGVSQQLRELHALVKSLQR